MEALLTFMTEVQDLLSDAAYQCGKTVHYSEQVDDSGKTTDDIQKVYHQLCDAQNLIAEAKQNLRERMKNG